MVWWKYFVPGLYQLRKGTTAGFALKCLWLIHRIRRSRTRRKRNPPRSIWYKFFEGCPLPPGSWLGNIWNKKQPRGGGVSFYQILRTYAVVDVDFWISRNAIFNYFHPDCTSIQVHQHVISGPKSQLVKSVKTARDSYLSHKSRWLIGCLPPA